MRDMARPIKVLAASKEVRAELRRRANGRSTEQPTPWIRRSGPNVISQTRSPLCAGVSSPPWSKRCRDVPPLALTLWTSSPS